MTLQQWLERIECLHPSEIELGLERVRQVASRLAVLHWRCPLITVAGTNGKGSTIALLESLAGAAGKRTGVYTSPHIHRFNERIRVTGQPVSDAALVAAFEQIEQARADVPLTYFEFSTLAALLLFQSAELDVLILEVGLGGRLDAVNILDADVAVVTSVGLDHMGWLGSTRERIAIEKCGIARVARPLLYGERDRPLSVDRCCEDLGALPYWAGEAFGVTESDRSSADGVQLFWRQGDERQQVMLSAQDVPVEAPLGWDNLATALQALALVDGLPTANVAAVIAGVAANTRLPGRAQVVILDAIRWLFDVGHNAEALDRLINHLPLSFSREGNTHVLLGMLDDKPTQQMITTMAAVVDHWHLLTLPPPRGLAAADLAALLPAPRQGKEYASAAQAVSGLQASIKPGDRVLVLGSFVTVAATADALGINLWDVHGDVLVSTSVSNDNRPPE